MRSRIPVGTVTGAILLPLAAAMLLLAPAAARADDKPATTPATAPAGPLSGPAATELLKDLAEAAGSTLPQAQSLLLGMRDPWGDSCVTFIPVGTLSGAAPPPLMPDSRGGPGTKITSLYLGSSRGKGPKEDFAWHQGLFRLILEGMETDTLASAAKINEMWLKAQRFSIGAEAWTALPTGLEAPKIANPRNWPSHCLERAAAAIAARNLVETQRWAAEFSSAMFALNDLHVWLDFLLRNQLYSLDFQAKCEAMFGACEEPFYGKYIPIMDISGFPAGILGLRNLENYLEVERQSEGMFTIAQEYQAALADSNVTTSASRWLPPNLRGSYLELRTHLSPANQKLWDQAPATPYERSYLTNMLFRSKAAKVLDRLGTVLERFSAATPSATLPELMDVIFYRGGDTFAGLEWGDRYDPRLMEMAAKLSGDKLQVALGAQQQVSKAFGGYANYGVILTLREALDKHKMDCTRATDMLGTLCRNAGRAGLYSVRWCGGLEGHTVAAIESGRYGEGNVVIVDGLAEKLGAAEPWPKAFFMGHAWPSDFFRGFPDIYAVEMSARGLDSHIWIEGYIIRGGGAGFLMRAAVPFRPGYPKPTAEKVYPGPYPGLVTTKPHLSLRTPRAANTLPGGE